MTENLNQTYRRWPWEPRCNHAWDDPEYPPVMRCQLRPGHTRTHLAILKERYGQLTLSWTSGELHDTEIGAKKAHNEV